MAGLQQFQIITDHKACVPILNNHQLDEIDNPGLQRLCTRLMANNFTGMWYKGNTNAASDAPSYYPLCESSQEDMLVEPDEEHNPAPSIAELRV